MKEKEYETTDGRKIILTDDEVKIIKALKKLSKIVRETFTKEDLEKAFDGGRDIRDAFDYWYQQFIKTKQ